MDCSPPGQSMKFSKQECWSGLPCPPPGDLPNPGIKSRSLILQVNSLLSKPPGKYMLPQFTLFKTIFLIFWEKKHWSIWKWKLLHCVQLLVTPWTVLSEFFGQNTGVGSLSFLQGAFPTQGSNPGLPHCRQILYQQSHKGSQRILVWVAYPFSSGSSQHKNITEVSCIADRFFTNLTMREALKYLNAWTKGN